MVKKKIIAIIPARGGSKRIPGKNIIDFDGQPLIAWTINAAKLTGIFDNIFVSTDDKEIANVAENYGVEVPFLRESCFDDFATVSDATLHTLLQIEKKLDITYDIVFQLMPNCPLRTEKHILESYDNFKQNDSNFQLSCFKFGWMNPWWSFTIDKDQKPRPLFPKALKTRSQDLETLYCPTGAIWIANVENFMIEKTFYGKNHIFFPIDWKAAVDIDDYEDLQFANVICQMVK